MTLIEEFSEGIKIISSLYPNANTGAEHDKIIFYCDLMTMDNDKDGIPIISDSLKQKLDDLGFYWDEDEQYWFYFT